MFNGVVFVVSLSELQVETSNTTFNPADVSDSNTVDRGKQKPLDVASDFVSDVLSEAATIFGV